MNNLTYRNILIIFVTILTLFCVLNYFVAQSTDYENNEYFESNENTMNIFKNHELTKEQSVLFVKPSMNVVDQITSIQNEINKLNADNSQLKRDVAYLKNIVLKMYDTDMNGRYIVNGWFVQFYNVDTNDPMGTVLSEPLRKVYGVPVICFRSLDRLPFLGKPDKPMFFPRADKIGFRAMTMMKVPKTGVYDFKLLTDDGSRLYYQQVKSDVMLNEKNVRTSWKTLIDSWADQAELWVYSRKLDLDQNDLILIRLDYYENSGFSSSCLKMRYFPNIASVLDIKTKTDTDANTYTEMDIPYESSYCSLLWSEVPLLGV